MPDRQVPANLEPDDAAEGCAELPIDGVLDLHAFAPEVTAALVADYLEACLARGILAVRIIHGKGIGVQRERVHAVLRAHPHVVAFGHPTDEGGWGATVVELRPAAAGAGETGDGR